MRTVDNASGYYYMVKRQNDTTIFIIYYIPLTIFSLRCDTHFPNTQPFVNITTYADVFN